MNNKDYLDKYHHEMIEKTEPINWFGVISVVLVVAAIVIGALEAFNVIKG